MHEKEKSLHNPKDCTDFCSGDPAGIRTPDTLLKRQVLCRLSYWVILGCVMDAGFARIDMAGTAGFAFLRKSHGGSNNPPDCFQEPPFESGAKKKQWQGRLDSNQRMSASKADALPLGDAPVSVESKNRPYPKHNALR